MSIRIEPAPDPKPLPDPTPVPNPLPTPKPDPHHRRHRHGHTPMRIECVTVCVDYADYLAETLPRNKHHFDRVVVVTAPHDKETQELCRRLSVGYHATDVFYRSGQTFNKAAGIAYGLSFLSGDCWYCHLDADTYLPPSARHWFNKKLLEPQQIYGVDRVNCVGYANWRRYVGDHHTGHDYMCRVKVPPFPLGDRIALEDQGGWLPIGYCQLWHSSTNRRYPTTHNADAERTDVLHAMQWEPKNRELIPEVIAVHLQADEAALGANWKGRKTPRFGPAGK